MLRASKRTASLFAVIPLALSLCVPAFVGAQSLPGVIEPLTVTVSPSTPRPNSTVTVTIQSFSVDVNRSDISWSVNGKAFASGKGLTSITAPTGAAGSATNITVDVATIEFGTLSASVSFRPADVTLLWKSDGYIPPFYKGKSLEGYGASFRVTAVPEFFTGSRRVDPKTLIYTWSKNGTVDPAQSGYGKDSYSGTQASFVRGGDEVFVQVSNTTGELSASKVVTISPTVPEVILYEESPLYGPVFEKALNDLIVLTEEEVTLRAEPYNMSIINPLLGQSSIEWSMNGVALTDFTGKRSLTLRKSGERGQQSQINLTMQHNSKMLQAGQATITISQ